MTLSIVYVAGIFLLKSLCLQKDCLGTNWKKETAFMLLLWK